MSVPEPPVYQPSLARIAQINDEWASNLLTCNICHRQFPARYIDTHRSLHPELT